MKDKLKYSYCCCCLKRIKKNCNDDMAHFYFLLTFLGERFQMIKLPKAPRISRQHHKHKYLGQGCEFSIDKKALPIVMAFDSVTKILNTTPLVALFTATIVLVPMPHNLNGTEEHTFSNGSSTDCTGSKRPKHKEFRADIDMIDLIFTVTILFSIVHQFRRAVRVYDIKNGRNYI